MQFETTSEKLKSPEVQRTQPVWESAPSDFKAFSAGWQQQCRDANQALLKDGIFNDVVIDFGSNHLIAQAMPAISVPGVPETSLTSSDQLTDKIQSTDKISQSYTADYSLEIARQQALKNSHKQLDGKDAKNNDEFLNMFLTGSGNDRQSHTKRGDPILEQFISSPGVQAMRDQYNKLGCPASINTLGYGTKDAFIDTVAKPAVDSLMHGFTNLFDNQHLGNVATQVGGFGNPPKEYPWATANATRCADDGKPDPNGKFVQYAVTNVAGAHSWALHAVPDKPLGASGPYRSIVQFFSWMEPIPTQAAPSEVHGKM